MINQMISKAVISPSAQFSRIAVIERGPEFERSVGEEEALRILMANAEDAYGFPPYPTLADQMSKWNGVDMHEAEKAIVKDALHDQQVVHIRRPGYDWYQRLPEVIKATSGATEAVIPALTIQKESVPSTVSVAQAQSSNS
jgi:hypothetical protein